MRNLIITVRESGITAIAGHPDGFPVDGDALHRSELSDLARQLIGTDEELLAAARGWLGASLNPNDPQLTPVHVTRLIEKLYTGGAARFITDRALVTA